MPGPNYTVTEPRACLRCRHAGSQLRHGTLSCSFRAGPPPAPEAPSAAIAAWAALLDDVDELGCCDAFEAR
jgi:hypothetical protein